MVYEIIEMIVETSWLIPSTYVSIYNFPNGFAFALFCLEEREKPIRDQSRVKEIRRRKTRDVRLENNDNYRAAAWGEILVSFEKISNYLYKQVSGRRSGKRCDY